MNEIVYDNDPNKIESLDYDYYEQIRQEEVKKCNHEKTSAYHIFADAKTLSEPNEICPHIQENCCGVDDQARIYKLWWRDRKRQENHHRAALLIFKWIFGFAKEFRRFASAIFKDWESAEFYKKQ